MTPSTPVRRAVSTMASAAVLALAFGFFPSGPALAATPDPSASPVSDTQAASDCGLVCMPILASSPDAGQTGRPRKTKEPMQPPAQPAPPADPPAQPVESQQPQANTPPQAGTPPQANTPDPAALPATPEAAPEGSATQAPSAAAGYRPPTGPSSGQDWNSPVTRAAGADQLAAVAPAKAQDPAGPALLPIALGTLLVGASAGAFAWWNRNRNRLRAH